MDWWFSGGIEMWHWTKMGQGLHKTFWGTAKKCENKFKLIFSLCPGSGLEGSRFNRNLYNTDSTSCWDDLKNSS